MEAFKEIQDAVEDVEKYVIASTDPNSRLD
jgi:hypothetical protein